MAENHNIFMKTTFVAVTGASRGLGESIALQFASKLPSASVMVLMARNVEALEHVKSELKTSAPSILVLVRQYDQGNVEETDYFNNMFDDVLKENNLSKDTFEQYMIVHNCGTPGDVSKTALQMKDCTFVRKYYDINVTGMILLNTSFFQTFSDSSKSRVIVNMTSRGSKIPTTSFGLYCAGKAARDMFFRVLAVEEPSLRILTCNPGPCDTDMFLYAEENTFSPSLSAVCKRLRQDDNIFTTKKSINGLVKLLEENNFENAVYMEAIPNKDSTNMEKLIQDHEARM